MAIDWSCGYRSAFRLMEVDRATWADLEEVASLRSVAVRRGDESLVETATAVVRRGPADPFGERWCRVEMVAEQGGEVELVPVATMLFAPAREEFGGFGSNQADLEARSVLSPAQDEVLLAGTYVAAGEDAAARAAAMLRTCIPAPVEARGSFRLSEPMVFARGTTVLEAVWMLLDAAGWTMTIDGSGRIEIGPLPTEPSLFLDRAGVAIIGGSVKREEDLWSVPNRYVAIEGSEVAVATNQDASDPTSHTSRGRWVDEVNDAPRRLAGEGLREYAERMLMARRRGMATCEWERGWWPGVTIGSVVRGGVPSLGIEGDMRVVSQDIECRHGLTVRERAEVI